MQSSVRQDVKGDNMTSVQQLGADPVLALCDPYTQPLTAQELTQFISPLIGAHSKYSTNAKMDIKQPKGSSSLQTNSFLRPQSANISQLTDPNLNYVTLDRKHVSSMRGNVQLSVTQKRDDLYNFSSNNNSKITSRLGNSQSGNNSMKLSVVKSSNLAAGQPRVGGGPWAAVSRTGSTLFDSRRTSVAGTSDQTLSSSNIVEVYRHQLTDVMSYRKTDIKVNNQNGDCMPEKQYYNVFHTSTFHDESRTRPNVRNSASSAASVIQHRLKVKGYVENIERMKSDVSAVKPTVLGIGPRNERIAAHIRNTDHNRHQFLTNIDLQNEFVKNETSGSLRTMLGNSVNALPSLRNLSRTSGKHVKLSKLPSSRLEKCSM